TSVWRRRGGGGGRTACGGGGRGRGSGGRGRGSGGQRLLQQHDAEQVLTLRRVGRADGNRVDRVFRGCVVLLGVQRLGSRVSQGARAIRRRQPRQTLEDVVQTRQIVGAERDV